MKRKGYDKKSLRYVGAVHCVARSYSCLTDAVEQVRAVAEKSEQALAAKVCWTMPALSCISRVFVALTIDDSVQNDVLAAKDAELEQASAALTSKVRLFISVLTCCDWTDARVCPG